MTVTERLTEGVRTALAAAGLPVADDCAWEVPRQGEHGDYATNVAMTLARAAKRPPRQIGAALPENGYPGEYLADLAREYRAAGGPRDVPGDERARLEHFGRWAVERMVEQQRRTLAAYGVDFDVWSSEQRDVRDRGLAEKAVQELTARGLTYEQDGALWFRSTAVEGAGDDQDRVLRRRTGALTYFAVDIAFHHYVKFAGVDHVIDLLGPDHHGHVPRMRAAMQALGHPPEAFEEIGRAHV